jgi:hypothetical protein
MLTAALLLTGCQNSAVELQQLDQVILLDVQGLWGGQDLWISDDGQAVCRIAVAPTRGQSALQEKRYRFEVSDEERATLLRSVNRHRFLSIRTKDRLGVPDEARPLISVKSGDKEHAVAKWAGDKHGDFDPIYQSLLEICESGETGKPVFSGTYDWDWKPDGFPENRKVRKSAESGEGGN